MRIGLAGANSSHAEDFLRVFNSEGRYSPFRLTAVCDADAARVAALRSAFPDLQEFESAEALVGACDAVIVCDRDGRQHRDHALPALQAGKPAFVNKPLAGSVADADVMVEAAAVSGAALLSASALRWQPQVQELRAQFESGSPPHRLLAYGSAAGQPVWWRHLLCNPHAGSSPGVAGHHMGAVVGQRWRTVHRPLPERDN